MNYIPGAPVKQIYSRSRWVVSIPIIPSFEASAGVAAVPGRGSFQSAKVRTGTRRRSSGVARRRFFERVALRGTRSSRSIVGAIMASHQYPALLGAGRGEIVPTDYSGQFGTRRKSHLGPHRHLQSDEGGMVAAAIASNISRGATQPSGNLLVEAMRR